MSDRRARPSPPARVTTVRAAAALVAALAIPSGPARAEGAAAGIDLVTGDDFGDFSGRDLDEGGMATEIVREAFAAAGLEARVAFDDWQAGYDATLAGEHDGAFPWYFLAERTAGHVYTDSIYELVERVFHLEGDPGVPEIRGAEDLAGLTLCYPAGWGAPAAIQAMFDSGSTVREEPGDMSRCFDLLADERVDAVLAPQLQGYATVEAHPELDAFDVATASWEVTIRTLSVLLPKSAGRERACRNAVRFGAGLATVRANGLFDAVARRWFGPLAQLASPDERYALTRRLADGGLETLAGTAIGLSGGRFLLDAGERGVKRVPVDEIAWIGREGFAEFDASRDWCLGRAGGPGAGAEVEPAARALPEASAEGAPADAGTSGRTLAVAGPARLATDLVPALLADWLDRSLAPTRSGFAVAGASNDPRKPDRLALVEGGADAAFAALADASVELALADRRPEPAETEALAPLDAFPSAATEHVLALEALVPVVHPTRGLDAIGLDALGDALGTGTADWAALAGDGAAGTATVHVEAALADALGAGAVPGLPPPTERVVRHPSRDAALAAVAADPDALGLVALGPDVDAGAGPAVDRGAARGVRAVGVADCGLVHPPTGFAARSEEHPLARRLYLYYSPSRANGFAGAFVRHAQSEAGQRVVADHGLVDLSIAAEGAVDRAGARANRARSGVQDASTVAGLDAATDGARRLSATFRFLPGDARLDARATRDAERLAAWLLARGLDGDDLRLVGYADARGGYPRNCELSRRRAASVAAALAREGVDGSPGTFGACEEAPVACNATDHGRRLNRRVEVWVRGAALGAGG